MSKKDEGEIKFRALNIHTQKPISGNYFHDKARGKHLIIASDIIGNQYESEVSRETIEIHLGEKDDKGEDIWKKVF